MHMHVRMHLCSHTRARMCVCVRVCVCGVCSVDILEGNEHIPFSRIQFVLKLVDKCT